MGMIQTTVFAGSLSNFACKLFMMRRGTLLIFGHGVKGQDQLWPPCEGMPRFALSSFYYTPDLSGRIMVWRWRLSVRPSVCGSVHKACKHDTD